MSLLILIWSQPQAVFSTDPPQVIESDSALVTQTGTWTLQNTPNASGGSYLYASGSPDDTLSLEFYGTRIEVVYVKHPSFGYFTVEIDNNEIRTVTATDENTLFDQRAVFEYLDDGPHTLRIMGVQGVVGIDAFIASHSQLGTPTATPPPYNGISVSSITTPIPTSAENFGASSSQSQATLNNRCTPELEITVSSVTELRNAVMLANLDSDQTNTYCVFLEPGEYNLVLGGGQDGTLVIAHNINFYGLSDYPNLVTLDGDRAERIMYIDWGRVELHHLHLTNGVHHSTSPPTSEYGGAILMNNGQLFVTDSKFSSNGDIEITEGGGAISGGGTFIRTQFTGNKAGGGGAIQNVGELTIVDSCFTDNHANWGGAILNDLNIDTITINRSNFEDNEGLGTAINNSETLPINAQFNHWGSGETFVGNVDDSNPLSTYPEWYDPDPLNQYNLLDYADCEPRPLQDEILVAAYGKDSEYTPIDLNSNERPGTIPIYHELQFSVNPTEITQVPTVNSILVIWEWNARSRIDEWDNLPLPYIDYPLDHPNTPTSPTHCELWLPFAERHPDCNIPNPPTGLQCSSEPATRCGWVYWDTVATNPLEAVFSINHSGRLKVRVVVNGTMLLRETEVLIPVTQMFTMNSEGEYVLAPEYEPIRQIIFLFLAHELADVENPYEYDFSTQQTSVRDDFAFSTNFLKDLPYCDENMMNQAQLEQLPWPNTSLILNIWHCTEEGGTYVATYGAPDPNPQFDTHYAYMVAYTFLNAFLNRERSGGEPYVYIDASQFEWLGTNDPDVAPFTWVGCGDPENNIPSLEPYGPIYIGRATTEDGWQTLAEWVQGYVTCVLSDEDNRTLLNGQWEDVFHVLRIHRYTTFLETIGGSVSQSSGTIDYGEIDRAINDYALSIAAIEGNLSDETIIAYINKKLEAEQSPLRFDDIYPPGSQEREDRLREERDKAEAYYPSAGTNEFKLANTIHYKMHTLSYWNANSDTDTILNQNDNCPYFANEDQADTGANNTTANNGIGDACEGDSGTVGAVTTSVGGVGCTPINNVSQANIEQAYDNNTFTSLCTANPELGHIPLLREVYMPSGHSMLRPILRTVDFTETNPPIPQPVLRWQTISVQFQEDLTLARNIPK